MHRPRAAHSSQRARIYPHRQEILKRLADGQTVRQIQDALKLDDIPKPTFYRNVGLIRKAASNAPSSPSFENAPVEKRGVGSVTSEEAEPRPIRRKKRKFVAATIGGDDHDDLDPRKWREERQARKAKEAKKRKPIVPPDFELPKGRDASADERPILKPENYM